MFKDEKTRYPGIDKRVHEGGKVVYVVRVRMKGMGERPRASGA